MLVTFYVSVGHQHWKDVTNIHKSSPTLSHQYQCQQPTLTKIFRAEIFEKLVKITCSASDQLVIGLSFQFHYFPYSNYKIFEKYFVPFLFVRFLLVRTSFRPIWKNHIDAKFLFWTIHNSLNKCKNYISRSHDFIFGLFVLWLESEPRIKPMNPFIKHVCVSISGHF